MNVNTENGWTSIDEIIRSWLLGRHEVTLHKYVFILNYALEGYGLFMTDTTPGVKSVKLEMSKVKTVKAPRDCIVWRKLGCQYGDRTLGFVNDNTITPVKADGATPNSGFSDFLGENLSTLNFINSNSTVEYSALHTGHNGQGYFREVHVQGGPNYFQFSSEAKGPVIMEYVANNFKAGAKTYINSYAALLIKRYIDYKVKAKKYGEASAETKEAWYMYGDELNDVRGRQNPFNAAGIMDAKSRSFTLGPKI